MEERPRLEIELDVPGAGRYADDLRRGALFVPGIALAMHEECDILFLAGSAAFSVAARVVFVDGTGVGFELAMIDTVKARLVELAEAAPLPEPDEAAPAAEASGTIDDPLEDPSSWGLDDTADAEPADAEADSADPDAAGAPRRRRVSYQNVLERLRGLTLVEQHKVAREGELHERMALERIYGKTVWEPLLRNPRITGHEVARISRMGNLARPQLEVIVGNATWLGVPEVRRALLSNPRLTSDMIPRVLRLLSKQELKLASTQIAYPALVREAARRMLREQGVSSR